MRSCRLRTDFVQAHPRTFLIHGPSSILPHRRVECTHARNAAAMSPNMPPSMLVPPPRAARARSPTVCDAGRRCRTETQRRRGGRLRTGCQTACRHCQPRLTRPLGSGRLLLLGGIGGRRREGRVLFAREHLAEVVRLPCTNQPDEAPFPSHDLLPLRGRASASFRRC